MISEKTFTTLATSTFALLFSVSLVFGDAVWTANIASSPNPATAAIGGSLEFWLEDEQFDITGLPDHECWTHGDQTTEYRWTVNGGAVEGNGSSATISSGNDGDVGAGNHSISFEGKTGYFICWTDEENNQQYDGPYQVGWLSFGSKGFTVVKVASVSCSKVTSTTGTPGLAETVHVAIGEAGSTISITATSYPPDSWPSGTPSWSTSNPDGSSPSEPVSGQPSIYARTDSANAFRVNASCGTSNAAIILKVIEVESLELEPDIGEEIDDGDPNTRTFLVPAAATGVVKVIATPNPDVADAMLLPDSWTLTGGTGTGKLSRTIDRTKPDIYELTCTCGTSEKKTKVIVVKVDLNVDSNNDGTINDTDDSLEFNAPGKLVYLNHDDDNKNDEEDKTENSSVVTNENDLQPMNLSFDPPTLSVGKIILSATSGASRIQVWKSAAKGVAADKVALPKTWTLGTDTVPSTLYVEGIGTGDVTLKLAYEVNTSEANTFEVCKDEVKMGVVKIDFKERSDTKYGYDDGTIDDNPVPTSVDNPPQKYDWVSIDKNMKTTDVDVEIIPSAYAQYIHFVASDTEKATCVPTQASSSPQKLTLTGKDIGISHIQTRLGTTSGAVGVRLNVACYQLAERKADFYKVQATGLVPDTTTTAANLESGANEYMKRGVSELELTDMGTSTIEYDDNSNSKLDIDTTVAGGGSEWNKIETNLNASPTGFKLLHVKAARVKIGSTWYDIAGLAYKDWIVVTDASSSKKRTVAHEMLHILTLKDVGPYGKNTANIMYYASNTTQYFVGYFKVERVQTGSGASYTPRQYQLQWDAIKRTTD